MDFKITSSPKGKKTQFVCTADGVEIGKRCSDEDYDKPYAARPVENLPSQLRLIRATLTNQICEAYDDGDYALQNTLTVIRSSIDALSDELQGL
jgi:hypothetical protein